MLLYRIGSTKYADQLTGDGAKINGGRWNHVGVPCIYTTATRSLALLEYTAHAEIYQIPRALSIITLEVPDHFIKICPISELPGNWKHSPHPREPRDFGTDLLALKRDLLIQLPSVILEEEMNFLINPQHPDMKLVKIKEIRDYPYDLRLMTN